MFNSGILEYLFIPKLLRTLHSCKSKRVTGASANASLTLKVTPKVCHLESSKLLMLHVTLRYELICLSPF